MSNDYGSLSQRTAQYAAAVALQHAKYQTCIGMFATNKPLPRNKADTIAFRRSDMWPTVEGAPLSEGVTPNSRAHTYTDAVVQIQQYGDVGEITDHVEDLAEDPVLNDIVMMQADQAGGTTDRVVFNVAKASTNVFYPGAQVARDAIVDPVDGNVLEAVYRALRRNYGLFMRSRLSASPNIATFGIRASYLAFGHTDLQYDLEQISGYHPVSEYGTEKVVHELEVGSYKNMRICLSPDYEPYADAGGLAATNGLVSTTGTNADVYPLVVLAKDGLGSVPLGGPNSMKISIINANVVSKSDILGQRGQAGWKCYFAALRLNEAWCAVAEVGATAL